MQPSLQALGLLETTGYTPAMIALDAMEKRANIRVVQAEVNDFLGIIIKITGAPDAVAEAIHMGRKLADSLGGQPRSQIVQRPDPRAWQAIESKREFNILIQQDVVHMPRSRPAETEERAEKHSMTEGTATALGFIETQGFTAVFEAIDTACKAANVEVVGKEKLGGGYVTVVVRGDVAAVKAAVEAGQQQVGSLGKLIAAHVISRPSDSVLALLPKL